MQPARKPPYWPTALRTLSKNDPVLGKIIRAYKGETMTSSNTAYHTLVRSIVGQQISVKAAETVWNKLVKLAKEIHPHRIKPLSEADLRACGLSGQKVKYLSGLSEYFLSEGNELAWVELEDKDVETKLLALKGIGSWTVEMFKMFHLLRPDILPLKDIGLQKAIQKHYGNKKPLSLTQMEKIAKAWQPYRSVATWYLWRSLDPEPIEY